MVLVSSTVVGRGVGDFKMGVRGLRWKLYKIKKIKK